ncbi:MAG TPA: TIGR03808 family TAT-translocated repetitive protein [Xanthobacteraceae bacterium]|nr:TIGR03808 family TAT-translocated repetitive protein [Xanthobacteraceae bacterium]
MAIDRRSVLGLSAGSAAGALLPTPSRATPQPLGSLGLDVTHFGVNAGSPDDQTDALQRAIDASAEARVPLWLPAGTYIAADLVLKSGTQLYGVRGATRLLLGHGAAIAACARADQVTLQGLVFDGRSQFLPEGRGLLSLREVRGLRILDCYLQESGGAGISLIGAEGEIAHTTIVGAAGGGITTEDGRGVTLSHNTIFQCGRHGIRVTRARRGHDGTQILANRIEHVGATEGDGIVIEHAGAVIAADNHIGRCQGSGIHARSAANLHVRGNALSAIGDFAVRMEDGSDGAIVAGNTIDGAAGGISVTDRETGGRLVACQGNLVRNLRGEPANGRGIGIVVEADSAITGNVIEGAPLAGILAGFGRHLRDVTVTGNVVRTTPIGVGVSVEPGGGSALIAHNLIADVSQGAVVGMSGGRAVTGDLAGGEPSRYASITVSGNRVR